MAKSANVLKKVGSKALKKAVDKAFHTGMEKICDVGAVEEGRPATILPATSDGSPLRKKTFEQFGKR